MSLLTDDSNVDTTGSEGSSFSSPSQSVFKDPSIKSFFGFFGYTKVRWRNALQDIVVVLGCTEDAG